MAVANGEAGCHTASGASDCGSCQSRGCPIWDRIGAEIVAVAGSFLFAGSVVPVALWTGSEPAYAGNRAASAQARRLRRRALGGRVRQHGHADLPMVGFTTGTAILSSFRQFGAVLGVPG